MREFFTSRSIIKKEQNQTKSKKMENFQEKQTAF